MSKPKIFLLLPKAKYFPLIVAALLRAREGKNKESLKHFPGENGLLECCQVELSVNFFEIGLMCHFTY